MQCCTEYPLPFARRLGKVMRKRWCKFKYRHQLVVWCFPSKPSFPWKFSFMHRFPDDDPTSCPVGSAALSHARSRCIISEVNKNESVTAVHSSSQRLGVVLREKWTTCRKTQKQIQFRAALIRFFPENNLAIVLALGITGSGCQADAGFADFDSRRSHSLSGCPDKLL